MGKKIVIVQPSFIPWLGYFNMMEETDVFVFLDDVQFTVRDWRNRNRVRTDKGWLWLTVPVRLERPYYEYRIVDVRIDNSQDWVSRHLKTFTHYYKRSGYFEEIFTILEKIYTLKHEFLEDLLLDLIFELTHYMGITVEFKRSIDMRIPPNFKKTERILNILEKMDGVDVYITGPKARNYLDVPLLGRRGIAVVWHEYEHPFYNQIMWGTDYFITHLSIVDLLFNHGKESKYIITGEKKIEKPPNVKVINANDMKGGRLPDVQNSVQQTDRCRK